ncbi:helix-turn-helix transcriptional regulator [Bifidobacterium dentium]|uniref:helix-turn-helix transcriptional regulator n=1 Tax=Bifidobacterium dentium TaxID=1689 RepID=UPI0018B0D8F5|nr:helix-turn-helix domain-containing protein [Bifidobacterium dentium]MBF9688052.1 helix-turn-helix domain-containing protein [Bifidobacterium dentium]
MEFLENLPNRLMTARELSDITGIAAGTLGNWRSTGRGPAFLKIGGGVFYDPSDVREFFMSISKLHATWEGR